MNILGGTAVGSLAAIVSALLYCDKFFCGTLSLCSLLCLTPSAPPPFRPAAATSFSLLRTEPLAQPHQEY